MASFDLAGRFPASMMDQRGNVEVQVVDEPRTRPGRDLSRKGAHQCEPVTIENPCQRWTFGHKPLAANGPSTV